MKAASANHDNPLSVAIIGAGVVAKHHVEAFKQLEQVRVLGVADVDETRAKGLAAQCGAKSFSNYHDLLELQPAMSVICLPHHLHREAALAAAAVGSHILMEKPLAHTLEDAHAILEACHEHHVKLSVSFVHRFRAEFQKAYQLIKAGDIGHPSLVVDRFCFPGDKRVPAWVWQKPLSGGGILMYSGIHAIDRLRWLLNSEVSELFARTVTHSHHADVEDGLLATLIFANGSVASLIENQPSYAVSSRVWDVEIYGSLARLHIQSGNFLDFDSDAKGYRYEVRRNDHFLAQASEFVAAVQEQREPWITGHDGLRALEVALAIYQSAESGKPIKFNHEK